MIFPQFTGHRVKGVKSKKPKGEFNEENPQEVQSGIQAGIR